METARFSLTGERGCGKINSYAGMVELADTLDLGSSGQPCRFKSCCPYQKQTIQTKTFQRSLGLDCLFFAFMALNQACGHKYF